MGRDWKGGREVDFATLKALSRTLSIGSRLARYAIRVVVYT